MGIATTFTSDATSTDTTTAYGDNDPYATHSAIHSDVTSCGTIGYRTMCYTTAYADSQPVRERPKPTPMSKTAAFKRPVVVRRPMIVEEVEV